MANGTVRYTTASHQGKERHGFNRINSKKKMGYGKAQIANEQPSECLDTSTMTKEQKAKYFASLGY